MKDERHQSEGDIREDEESDDCKGEICNNVVAAKGKDDKSCEEQEHGKEEKER